MVSGAETLLKQQEVPSGHDPAQCRCWRLMAHAPDGEQVPVTVLGRHDTPIDGSAPLLLYGYGAYGHAIDPVFSTRTLSLVDRGWFYAIAHVRGGSEKAGTGSLADAGATSPTRSVISSPVPKPSWPKALGPRAASWPMDVPLAEW